MMKLLHQKLLRGFLIMALFLTAGASWGQIATWNSDGLSWGPSTPTWPAESTAANATVTGFVRGSGLTKTGSAASDSYGANGAAGAANAAAAISSNKFFTFTAKANTGYKMSVTGMPIWFTRKSSGNVSIAVQYSIDNASFVDIGSITISSSSGTGSNTPLAFNSTVQNALSNLPSTSTVTFRFLVISTAANVYLVIGSGDRFQLNGTITSANVAPAVANASQTRTFGQTATPFNISSVTTGGTATGYNAINLPAGATINTTTGVISFDGTTPVSATPYSIGISATNTSGTGSGTLTLTVNKATQAISSFANISKVFGSADFNLTATGGASGNPVVYSIENNPAVAILNEDGHSIHIVGAWSVNITATHAGNDNYNAVTLTRTLTVTQATQAITFNTLTGVMYGDASFELTATGGASGNNVTFSSNDTTVATVSGNTVTIVGAGSAVITANQAGTANYSAAAVPRTLTVAKKPIIFSGGTAQNKVYDTTTAVTLTTPPAPTGIIEGDVVTLSGTPVYSFGSANAGIQTVNLTGGYTINNNNYVLNYPQQPAGLTAAITTAPLTLGGLTAANKVYDGSANATISGTPVITGILGSDAVAVAGTAVGTFANAEIGLGKEVTISGFTLTGAQANNYNIQPTVVYADITDPSKLDQDITFTGPATFTYGDAAYPLNGYATTNSGLGITSYYVQPGDEAIANVVGTTLEVYSVGTFTLYAFQEGNSEYNGTTESVQVTVNPKALTVVSTSTITKVYDGTDIATVTAELNGVVSGDVVTLSIQDAVYEDKNTGTSKEVIAEFEITGVDAPNYILPVDVLELTGSITPAPVSVTTQATAQNKVYNGTETVSVSGGTLTGVIAPDVVTLSATGTFDSADVANGITVNLTYALGGTAAANYALTANTGNTTANITPAALTITGLSGVNKVYDATTAATLAGTAILNGVIEGDNVTPAGTIIANFTTAAVGNNKIITVTGFTLAGDDAGNYTVSQPVGITANITAKTITATITGATVTPKAYNGTNAATLAGVALNGIESGDTVNATTGIFTSINAATDIPVTINLTGSAANNYALTQPEPGMIGTINKKALTATADNKNKTVGAGNPVPALTVSYVGFISGENAANAIGFVAPTAATTATNTAAIGAYPITLSGGSATNYDIALTNGWVFVNPSSTFENILIWSFSNGTESPLATADAGTVNTNLDSSSTLTRGPGAEVSPGQNSFRTVGFQNDGIAVTNQDYFQFVASADPGFTLSLKTITAKFVGTTSFHASPGVSHQFAYSLNGSTFTLIGNAPTVIIGTGDLTVDLSGVAALQNVPASTTITLRYYASGQTATGGWGFAGGNGLVVSGALTPSPAAPQITSALTYSTSVNSTGSYQLTASGDPTISLSAGNLPTGATVNTTGLITFDGTTPVGSYNISLTASSYYGNNTKTLVYTVDKLNQVVTFNPDPLPVKQVGDLPFLLEYSNNSGLPVSWNSSQTGVATIDAAGNITITGPGTTTITASNPGNELYNAVSVTRTLTVRQLEVTPSPINTLHAYQGQAQSNNFVQLTQVTGANLTPANGSITVAASTGFIVSTNNQVSYGPTGTIAYTGGAINLTNPNIFVKLESNLGIGEYTGTLTFTGGGATTVVNLSGTVGAAPSINTIASSYGPYCVGTTNNIAVSYTTQGNFGTGNFYVQHSDATGIFPTDFSNIISNASAVSPIDAILPNNIGSGNYRVRVVHVSSNLLLTGSTNDNGSNIAVIATPTLISVSASAACSGSNADITLNGLTPNASFAVNYTVNGGTAQQVTVLSNGISSGSFVLPVTNASNGQQVAITALTRNDVTAACTQTFSANNTTAIAISNNTWTGTAANHNWNDAANWSCGEVPSTYTAIIAPSASSPEIDDAIEVSNLTVNAGATITVKTGATLTVQNALVNNGQIIVQNNAALVQASASAYSGNGTATVTRTSNPLFRLDYTLWGSPVTAQQLQAFSQNTLSNRFYTYAYNWNVPTLTNREQYFAENAANNFIPGKAYLIRTPDFITGGSAAGYAAGTETYTQNGTFNGALNNGNVSVTTVATNLNGGGELSQAGHYIAVANPYASPISVKEFFDQNSNVLEDGAGIYFWRKKNDAASNSYAHLSLMGYTSNGPIGGAPDMNGTFYGGNTEGSTAFNDNWILSPAQGFLVKLKTGLSNTATVNFTNSMRKPAQTTQPFFKTANTNNTPAVSRLWINLANSNSSAFSQAAVGYLAEGTLGLDYGYDAKMLGDGNAKLYSKEAGANLAIQARPAFEATDVVSMGFAVTAAGQYTINLDHVDGIFSGSQDVYLKDNMAGTIVNLKENAYTFTTDAGTFDTRFEVVYVTGELGIGNPEINNNVVIYQEGKELKIASSLVMDSITVFDMLGRAIYTENGINATEFAKTFNMAQEVAIVKVTMQNGTTISKKVIIK